MARRRRADTAAGARAWLIEDSTLETLIEEGDDDLYLRGNAYVVRTKTSLLDDRQVEFSSLVITPQHELGSQRPLWCVYGKARLHHAGLFIDELSITTLLPEAASRRREINSLVMRAISPATILAAVRDELSGELLWDSAYQDHGRELLESEDRSRVEREVATERPTGRRRQRPPEFYERLAREYLRLVELGWRRGIHAQLAKALVLDETAARQMRDHIRRARELGFLSFGKSGKVGALPGPNLKL